MLRIGLTLEQSLAATWGGQRPRAYAAHLTGLSVLAGETLALVGPGAGRLRDRIAATIGDCVPIEGPAAAERGTLRIHAQQAVRVGLRGVVVSDPFVPDLSPAASDLAVADLAGLSALGLTCVVDLADPALAALVADRIVVVRDGAPVTAYPVVAPTPRLAADVSSVLARTRRRLAALEAEEVGARQPECL